MVSHVAGIVREDRGGLEKDRLEDIEDRGSLMGPF